jgi:hypothetical protein
MSGINEEKLTPDVEVVKHKSDTPFSFKWYPSGLSKSEFGCPSKYKL